MQIKFNSLTNRYELMFHGTYFDSKPVNEQLAQYYATRKFKKIFPKFKSGDLVGKVDLGGHTILTHSRKVESKGKMPYGFYVFGGNYDVSYFKPLSIRTFDEYLKFNDKSDQLYDNMLTFFNKRKAYKKLNLTHRRGALLYGTPGNGKTLSIIDACGRLKDTYVVFLKDVEVLYNLLDVRKSFKGDNIVFIIEEITQFQQDAEALLTFLDGESSWENAYVIATTNYPAELEDNITKRPGRFDFFIEYQVPDADARLAYFKHFGIDGSIVKKTKDMSFVYLKEIIARHKIYGLTLDMAFDEVYKTQKTAKDDFKNKPLTGSKFGV